ncbi:MAG: hypothetical protein P4L84_21215 [Isosphaeraceae bacterium]|nr:hypothetical protein [Isosphaeraceae bacterium]
MTTSLLLFLTLLPAQWLPTPGLAGPRADEAAFAPQPLEGREASGFLPEEAAEQEESEEEWYLAEQPSARASIAAPDDNNDFHTHDSDLSPHPLHERDRRGSPRSPPSAGLPL